MDMLSESIALIGTFHQQRFQKLVIYGASRVERVRVGVLSSKRLPGCCGEGTVVAFAGHIVPISGL
jgi:hypothetical protein